jgi:hypothetical protein
LPGNRPDPNVLFDNQRQKRGTNESLLTKASLVPLDDERLMQPGGIRRSVIGCPAARQAIKLRQ